jgi:hypothetical protein
MLNYINLMIWQKMFMLYGPWIQWLFYAEASLTGGHYRTDIISDVCHPRSNSIVPLVLCMVAYNIRDTGVVLQVPRDNANPARKEVISQVDYR